MMEQKHLFSRAHYFKAGTLRSEFDSLFDTNGKVFENYNIVNKRRSEQLENRIW